MATKNPYQIIKHRYVTEKSKLLENLKDATGSKSLKRFKLPKYVFIVDPSANKKEIADAIEEIYNERKIKVVSVNTMNINGKPKQIRGRGAAGKTAAYKKAIITLEEGDSLDNV